MRYGSQVGFQEVSLPQRLWSLSLWWEQSSALSWEAQVSLSLPTACSHPSTVAVLRHGTRIRRLGTSPGHESESGQNRASFG